MVLSNATLDAKIRRFFYVVTPSESYVERVDDVPNYIDEAIPLFMMAIMIEYLIATVKGLPSLRLNDGISSVSAGVLSELPKVLFKTCEVAIYIYVYENYRIWDLPWNSALAWWICFIGMDFGYYWAHRAAHEVNFLWAAHQVHHSSEDYNLSTALRQSVLQKYTTWIFLLPLALIIPPPMVLIHYQFNLLYQFWIHTEIVSSMGPLEYILNTPSHHRVHHGRNRYCIDKNYAGVLIIWDRMFGTFQPEMDEKPVYGLVHSLNSWDPIYIQVCHIKYMFDTIGQMEGWKNKLSFIFKGPGWIPGSPRLGFPSDIPEIEYPVERYNKTLDMKRSVYAIMHFMVMVIANQEMVARSASLSAFHILATCVYFILSVTSIGAMFDHKSYAAGLEIIRCLIFIVVDLILSSQNISIQVIPSVLINVIRGFYVLSTFVWMSISWNDRRLVQEDELKEKDD